MVSTASAHPPSSDACARWPSRGSSAGSELVELGVGRGDAHALDAEVDEDCDLLLDANDRAKPVTVVGDPVVHGEHLNLPCDGGAEGTARQMAPGHGAGGCHHHHYDLADPRKARPDRRYRSVGS